MSDIERKLESQSAEDQRSQRKKSQRRKKDSLGVRKSNNKFRGENSPLFFYYISNFA
ncbi:hypothetical protein Ct9H90mP29_11780 [bacterium]|nr:MAG: hypothetical protein Ct9H90mP29_11780 [bacterium]